MESIRQQDISLRMQSKQALSIFDLGVHPQEILERCQALYQDGIAISLQEFPAIDMNQGVNNKPLLELILEVAVLIENNRKQIAKQKQAQGIANAREKGIKLGRREKKIPENFVEIYEQVLTKKMTMKKATEILEVDYKTYRKWVRQYKE